MRKIIFISIIASVISLSASAQSYVKLNGVYALAGIINPSIELPVSNKFTYNAEVVFSPWKSIGGRPMNFGIGIMEARWHPKGNYNGWYFAPSVGMQGFYMAKDKEKDCKGWGIIVGASAGYQWQVSKRIMLEAFLGYGWQHSWYVGYQPGTDIEIYEYNMSAEWLPYKVGFNIGYKFFDPNKRRK